MDVDSVEPNVILRVPPAIASQLHQMIANKNTNTTSTTAATFSLVPIDERKFAFALHRDGESTVLPAFLMDLPCIVEAQKTFDKSTYYKAADISQMIVVSDPDNPFDPNGKYELDSGLTPPTRNIRSRVYQQPTHDQQELAAVEHEIAAIVAGKKYVDEIELIEFDDPEDTGEAAAEAAVAAALAAQPSSMPRASMSSPLPAQQTSSPAHTSGQAAPPQMVFRFNTTKTPAAPTGLFEAAPTPMHVQPQTPFAQASAMSPLNPAVAAVLQTLQVSKSPGPIASAQIGAVLQTPTLFTSSMPTPGPVTAAVSTLQLSSIRPVSHPLSQPMSQPMSQQISRPATGKLDPMTGERVDDEEEWNENIEDQYLAAAQLQASRNVRQGSPAPADSNNSVTELVPSVPQVSAADLERARLQSELDALKAKVVAQEAVLAAALNVIIKKKASTTLAELQAELAKKQAELDALSEASSS